MSANIAMMIGANKKSILLVVIMMVIVGVIGFEILLVYSAADSGTRELKKILSFSGNIMVGIGGVNSINDADTNIGLGRLNFDFGDYDKLVNSTRGLNYTSGYALFNATLNDIFNNGDKSIWKETLN